MLEDACLPLLVLVCWWMHSWGPLLMAGAGKDRRMQDVRDPDLGPFPPFPPKPPWWGVPRIERGAELERMALLDCERGLVRSSLRSCTCAAECDGVERWGILPGQEGHVAVFERLTPYTLWPIAASICDCSHRRLSTSCVLFTELEAQRRNWLP